MNLPWSNIWAEFDEAYEKAQSTCKTCKHTTNEMEWVEQMKLIERIVNKYAKRKVK